MLGVHRSRPRARPSVNLRQLEFFVRVAEQGSFSRAAATLGVSQPALSRSVRQLETGLRQHLLYRTGRGVEPTDAGKCFLSYGNAMLELMARAQDELRALKSEPAGRVALGLPPRVARVLVPDLVAAFAQRYPRAALSIAEGLSASLRDALLLGRLEIALLYDPPPSPRLEYRTLLRERLVLAGTPAAAGSLPARVRVADLGRYPLLLPAMPNAIRAVVEAACRAKGTVVNVAAEVDSVGSLVELALRGHGCAVLPESAAAPHAARGRLGMAALVAPEIRNRLVLALARRRPLGRLAAEAARLILEADLRRLLGAH